MSGSWIKFSDMKLIAERYGLDVSRPSVMAIVNVTPDSFYAASRTFDEAAVVERVRRAVEEGCSVVDVGGCSSRPGADDVPLDEEIRRVELGIRCVRQVSKSVPVSVDTFRSEVVAMAVAADERIIVNDISAGEFDPRMIAVVAEADVPYIAMHMRGRPSTMSQLTDYGDVVSDVVGSLLRRVDRLVEGGIRCGNILLDPGFGFAKTVEQNYELLAGVDKLCELGFPIVAGVSRKSMIYKVLETVPDECLAGTAALHWELLRRGVSVLRVHDTRAAVDVVKLYEKFKSVNDK